MRKIFWKKISAEKMGHRSILGTDQVLVLVLLQYHFHKSTISLGILDEIKKKLVVAITRAFFRYMFVQKF